MREMLIGAARTYYMGMINKHIANVEILLTNPVGIGEHSDVLGAIQDQLDIIAKAEERIDVINKHFIVHH